MMKTLPDLQPCLARQPHGDPAAAGVLAEAVRRLIGAPCAEQQVAVVCIGTDRSTGDCLGPLTGLELLRRGYPAGQVLGTLEEPVHAANLAETLSRLAKSHPGALVIAVDACLGSPDNVGTISVSIGPLRPGAGVNKSLPPVGEVAITGVVNVSGFMEYFVLQNTRLALVMRMAEVIASSILAAVAPGVNAAAAPDRLTPAQRSGSWSCALCRASAALTAPSPT